MPTLTKIAALLLLLLTRSSFASGPAILIADEPGVWREIFASVGLTLGEASDLPPAALPGRVESGAIAILQGISPFSEHFGIRQASPKLVPTRQIRDARAPSLPIIWEKSLDLPEVALPADATVFARERWSNMPVLAGIRRGKGAVLWVATPPGPGGYARYPYLLQALSDLGLDVPARSNRLWAFLDTSYRTRVDVDYIADRWQKLGISALHVAAWHYNEPSAERDAWLARVIDACHKRGILVYAWLELPHVSEKFWTDHPEWREKTAVLQDAHLDWRKLMNLNNRDCFRAVESAVRDLTGRFDWDGINFGELYYESLEGAGNPARFTPMNPDIRAEYHDLTGVDPLNLFDPGAKASQMAAFLLYRAESARRMQSDWLQVASSLRETKPFLDLVLTHVDDRFDPTMRDKIGADAERVLPLLNQHDFTFLIEDPATVWHLGPARYREIAERYKPITPRPEKLAIDINIVERYQDVYPTKQQTGVELFRLIHTAAQSFPRVALYFESSLPRPDLDRLPAAASGITRLETRANTVIVDSRYGAGVRFPGPALVDGKPWPVASATTVWLAPGAHVVTKASGPLRTSLRVENLNAELRSASVLKGDAGIEFAYQSGSRATAQLSAMPSRVEIDGEPVRPEYFGDKMLVLPRGQHVVTLRTASGDEPVTVSLALK
ncbi:MAG: hypothetical protein SGI92_06575 [Bryobacteraceae bacterium]|nr:hypothetical protein [Bryobacteraceae bacterium]